MRIGVVGAGTMGHGIAQVAAFHGYKVRLQDVSGSALEKARGKMQQSLNRIAVKKAGEEAGQLVEETLARIEFDRDLESFSGCDFVVEAVFEDLQVKVSVLEKLDRICPEPAIIATNTSSISITKLASSTARPEMVVGMHFMNPVPIMRLVEIIRGFATSDETYRQTRELAEKLGKIPVEVNDSPGFVSNRVLMPMVNEAIFAVQEGVATPEAVDQVMKLGMNHPMGPLQLADFIGLDVCLDILHVLYKGFKDPKYRPCPLLQKMVDAGHLGRKSGRGFYGYG